MDFTARAAVAVDGPGGDIEWQEIDCLLCGSDNWSPLVEAPDPSASGAGRWFMVVQCRECGLCFTNPRPTADSIGQFYLADYPPHQPRERDGGPHWWQRVPLLRRWQDPRRILPRRGDGRLLDFGCGNGSFLLRMRRQGWNVVGIDNDAGMIERLHEMGISAVVGTLPHPELPDDSFDTITMWQSLEHVHQPLEALRGAYRLLAPGGRLLVATPNIDSLAFRWFGPAWSALDLPRHLTHFSPWTMRMMLHRAGFRAVRVRMQRRGGWLRDSAAIAARLQPRLPLSLRWLHRRGPATLVSWYGQLTRQADCMLATAVKS
jgi:SAM-dependent methyltransferase